MSAKHSPKKVTLAMMKGKPITTSVPVIHYHASDDELEEIYPSTDEDMRFSPELEKTSPKITFSPSKSSQEDESVCKSSSAENILSDGIPPALDPWKIHGIFSEIKGKITKTFEEKLSEMKSDKRKRAESSSISDSEDQGSLTPSNEKAEEKQANEPTTTTVHRRGNPARYVGFSGVKTGLKDKSLQQDESVESGVEASEFPEEESKDDSKNDSVEAANSNDSGINFPTQQTYMRPVMFRYNPANTKVVLQNLKNVVCNSIKELICQATFKSFAALIAILCIYYVIPLAQYLLGFIMGVCATVYFYNLITKLEKILTTLPEEKRVSNPSIPVLEIPAVEEHAVVEKFQGWVNELPFNYEPNNYHVARTKSVYFRLEDSTLRIMDTRMKVPKKTVWDEAKHKLKFVRRRVYNLSGAKVELLPHGLTRRRRWSKKYPICITVEKKALTCNVILKNTSNDERSVNNYHRKATSKARVKYKIEKKRGDEDEMQEDDEVWFVNTEDEELRAEYDNRDEDGSENENNYDSTNSNNDNEHLKYEECILENEEMEECTEEKEKKKEDKEEEQEEIKEDDIDINFEQDELEEEWEDGWEEEEDDDEEEDEEEIALEEDDNDYEIEMKENDVKEEDGEEEHGKKKWKTKSIFKKYLINDKRKNELKIFIFTRADREKEDWYRRLTSAASRGVKKQESISYSGDASSASGNQSTQQKIASGETKNSFSVGNSQENVPELSFSAYMAKYLESSPTTDSVISENMLWINCLIARVLFDLRKCPETISLIQDRIQRKLSKIKLPYFMECLLVSEVAIGQGAPVIRNITKPVTNERGLWLDLDVTYKGSLAMTVETKLNLMKLTRTGSVPANIEIISTEKQELTTRSPIFDSDLEDTPETSTEDECCNAAKEATPTQSSGKKFLSMVDKIAANKYFQHATELSYIRRAMKGVSNTEIRLMVTVSSIEGCLSVNIPPAPSDRLWYGFKPVPKVNLTVKPAVGERTVNIVYVTKWIEAKLLREFEKLVVLPNMDDLIVPLCPNYPYTTIR